MIAPPPPATTVPAAAPLKPGRIRRVTGLDGLRGIAVLAVVVYHFFGDVLPGGFLGVDVFFVLSGFLITSLLVREIGATGGINLKEFWRRRARRILPAAVTVLLVSTAVAGIIGGDVAVALVPQFLGSLFSVNNWVQIAESNSYFAGTTPQIFMHYWSLAIEEQFYVLWPLLLLACLWFSRHVVRRNRIGRTAGPFRVATVVATVLGISSLVAMIILHDPDTDPSRVYFGTDTHAFGMLAGVVLALVTTSASSSSTDSWPAFSPATGSRRSAALAWAGGTLALVALAVMFLLLPDTDPLTYRGGLFLASLLSVALIATSLREAGPVAGLLRWRPLRWFGERSFSLYLWHWPVVVFAGTLMQEPGSDVPDWAVGAVAVVVSLALTEASYRWVETPLRRNGYRRTLQSLGTTKLLAVPVAVLAVTLLAGSALGQSPAKSELETQLEEMAELQDSPAPAQDGPVPPSPPRAAGLPAGSEITAIGDSVMLASTLSLQQRFPGITIDAETSRHYTGGEGPIGTMAANGSLGEYVVLGFGTNGQAFDGQLDRIVETIGPGHKIVLVVPYGYVDGIAPAAQQTLDYAASHPDIYLAPWCQMALDHPDSLIGDGVHPADAGQSYYADAVEKGLRQAVAEKQDASISCAM
ncbi:acyltransferase family protein [Corynebacterium sp. USCH3]|uniref:acyltransferase family protein n=1 Tax=Corynebacterium sp. USCH3 TaxID=3024840 RepID=UPI0030B2C466